MNKKANKGWIKELDSKAPESGPKQTFAYKAPIVPTPKTTSLGFNHRTKEHKSVKADKSTNFSIEQAKALASHKGK